MAHSANVCFKCGYRLRGAPPPTWDYHGLPLPILICPECGRVQLPHDRRKRHVIFSLRARSLRLIAMVVGGGTATLGSIALAFDFVPPRARLVTLLILLLIALATFAQLLVALCSKLRRR